MAKNVIELTRGDTLELHIDLTGEDGQPYSLKEGDKLDFTVKCSASSPDALIHKQGQDITIEPADTRAADSATDTSTSTERTPTI